MVVTWNPISLTGVQPVEQTTTVTDQNDRRRQQSHLQAGRTYQGRVSGQTADGRFFIDIAGRRYLTKNGIPLQVGRTLDLLVVATSPRLELQIVADPLLRGIGRSVHLLNRQPDIPQILSLLLQQTGKDDRLSAATRLVFEQFAAMGKIVSEEHGNGRLLHELINRLGLNLEQLLTEDRQEEAVHTLKNGLLESSRLLAPSEIPAGKINQLLQILDLFQLLQIRLAGESLLFVPLPLPFLDQGYLLVDDRSQTEQQDEEQEAGWTYSLHLKLRNLGNVRIELRQSGEKLWVRFFCEDGKRQQFLAGLRDELQKQMSPRRLESVIFGTGAGEPVPELLEKVVTEEIGVINTRA